MGAMFCNICISASLIKNSTDAFSLLCTGFVVLGRVIDVHTQNKGGMCKDYGEAVQCADGEYHATCLSVHVLQQYGEKWNESKDTTIPHGT